MAGISDRALQFGKWNRYQYNGIEHDTTFGIDDYEAKLRDLDDQTGRWWQIDPKSENTEDVSPYASNDNNPIRYKDPDGDEPDGGCCDGLMKVVHAVSDAINSGIVATAGFANGAMHTATMGVWPTAPLGTDMYNDEDKELYNKAAAVGSMAPLPMPEAVPGGNMPDVMPAVVVPDGGATPAATAPSPAAMAPAPIDGTTNTQDRVQANSGGEKTYQTYTKEGPNGETYSGRTSGTGDPRENVANRDANHHMNDQGYGPAKLDATFVNSDAARGREQMLIDANGGAKSTGGTSGNAINGISATNPNRAKYINAAASFFKPLH